LSAGTGNLRRLPGRQAVGSGGNCRSGSRWWRRLPGWSFCSSRRHVRLGPHRDSSRRMNQRVKYQPADGGVGCAAFEIPVGGIPLCDDDRHHLPELRDVTPGAGVIGAALPRRRRRRGGYASATARPIPDRSFGRAAHRWWQYGEGRLADIATSRLGPRFSPTRKSVAERRLRHPSARRAAHGLLRAVGGLAPRRRPDAAPLSTCAMVTTGAHEVNNVRHDGPEFLDPLPPAPVRS
jgi:hypothetical protein